MLQLKNIIKDYTSKNAVVHALKGVSINFRECEFASILGPSGCGKTTMLNIIGGLDRYTSGNLIINGISTQDFTDEYWDAYRNSEIGFVFQSYNLIPHLTVLANVELALKLSGLTKQECTEKAVAALKKVNMDSWLHHKPYQLSGGQMQRVSIARALVNDPKIILADEPTGALDSELGEQVMEVLKEVAQEKLVIMVTHNDDLAQRYSTRIINIKDGEIIADSNPYEAEETEQAVAERKTEKKRKIRLPRLNKLKNDPNAPFRATKMKWTTALGISWRNLISKVSKTTLTSVAGSIGIIGMGLVLALSNGIDVYLETMKTTMLASVPIGVYEYSMDYDVMQNVFETFSTQSGVSSDGDFPDTDEVYLRSKVASLTDISGMLDSLTSSLDYNDITPEFVEYVDKMDSSDYVAIHKYYGTRMNLIVKKEDGSYEDVSPAYKVTNLSTMAGNVLASSSLEADYWNQLVDKKYMTEYYDVLYGSYPKSKDEIVLVVNENNEVSYDALRKLGYNVMANEREYLDSVSFEDICKHTIHLVLNNEYYQNAKDESDPLYTTNFNLPSAELYEDLYNNKTDLELKVVGVLRVKPDAPSKVMQSNLCYTSELAEYVTEKASVSKIAIAQKALYAADSNKTVFNDALDTDYKVDDNRIAIWVIMDMLTGGKELSAYNRSLGVDTTPVYMNIYAASYDGKERIVAYLDKWNEESYVGENGDTLHYVKYFDVSEMFLYNIQMITNLATLAMLAVAAISLLVSSIMIAIITSNSVAERTREIGILRSIGAKKTDILSVFIAETFIIGALSGLIGIGLTYALAPAVSGIVQTNAGIAGLCVVSPWATGGLLLLSIVLAVISGFIPSLIASKKNVVDALHSD